jgi:L-malate glycosyltransferase
MKSRAPLRLCQFYRSFVRGDAVSRQAMAIHQAVRAAGVESALFGLEPGGEDAARPCGEYAYTPGDVVILHYGGDSPLARWGSRLAAPVFLYYHGVTPAHFYTRLGPGPGAAMAGDALLARDALPDLAYLGGLAALPFNQRELLLAGFRDVRVLPYILEFDLWRRMADSPGARAAVEQMRQPGVTNWLHTGPHAPHKRIEDIVRAFFVYHTRINPQSRLWLVEPEAGPEAGAEAYAQPLRQWVAKLGLQDAVMFTGRVEDQERLTGYYCLADVYVCMSEHEGFCVPLLEAMIHRVPILACRSTGVSDLLGDAGVLMDDRDPRVVAQAAALLCHNPAYRERVVDRQLRQAEHWSPERATDAVYQWLESL